MSTREQDYDDPWTPNYAYLESGAVDIATPAGRLVEILEASRVDPAFKRRIGPILARHPNLPLELISELFSNYPVAALRNPALPLLLLESRRLLDTVVEGSLIEMLQQRSAPPILISVLEEHPTQKVRDAALARSRAGVASGAPPGPGAIEQDEAWRTGKVLGLEGVDVEALLRELQPSIRERDDRFDIEACLWWGKAAPHPNWILNMTLLANRPDLARRLLEAGVDPREPDLSGEYAWNYAYELKTAKLLLEYGISPNGADPSRPGSWLNTAARHKKRQTVKLLLQQGADPNAWVPAEESPLMTAARAGDVESANLLLEAGADVNASYVRYIKEIVTPLTLAAQECSEPMVELLLERGADLTLSGVTALYNAAHHWEEAAPRILRRLLEAGVDPNGVICLGTPLHAAVDRNNRATATVLLAAGADPLLACSTDPRSPGTIRSPLDQAREENRKAIIQLFEDHLKHRVQNVRTP